MHIYTKGRMQGCVCSRIGMVSSKGWELDLDGDSRYGGTGMV